MIAYAVLILVGIVFPIGGALLLDRIDRRLTARRDALLREKVRRRAAEIHGRTTLVIEIVAVDNASPAFRAAAESAAKIGGR